MTFAPDLVLRDIHEPAAPALWPPAPGWWLLALLVLVIVGALVWRCMRRRWRRRRAQRIFDEALARHAAASPARIAAMSELLRRAARLRDPAADRLEGEDWLRFLDQDLPEPAFVTGIGRELLQGGFRRDANDIDMDALERLARQRFIHWMAP